MSSKPPRAAQKDHEGKPPKRRPIIIRIFRALKGYEDSRRRRREKEARETDLVMARWTRRVGLFTLALVLVSIITGGIFWKQLGVMQGQLDEMVADRRPWLDVSPRISRGIKFSVFFGDPHIFIPIDCDVTNYGDSPARNVILRTRIDTVPPVINNEVKTISDQRLADICKDAFDESKKHEDEGIPIFQNKRPTVITEGSEAIDRKFFQIESLTIYMVQGCVDYTYSEDRHAQTTFRYLIGKFGADNILHGIPFIQGTPVEGAKGNLIEGLMDATSLDFPKTEGGNYAK